MPPTPFPRDPQTVPDSAEIASAFVNGKWESHAADQYMAVNNPSTASAIARTPLATGAAALSLVDRAVAAASDAFAGWSETPVVERARVMFAYRDLIEKHDDELAALITREHGKTLAESRAEVQRGLEMVEFATGMPTLMMGDTFPQIARNVDGETNRTPLGVCVGITPYNFPHMVPLWMFPIAIAAGNTFILKPSEKVPLSAIRLGELLIEAGLPDGVFNLIHGGKPVVDALLTHADVKAVSFVGSTGIAKYVYQTATAHGKRVQSAGGAKNHLIIMPDADLDQSVKALAASAYGCAGQRCMAGSVALAVGAVGDKLVDHLVDYANTIKTAPTDAAATDAAPTDENEAADMGPVISPEHRDRVAAALDTAQAEGAAVPLDGRTLDTDNPFLIGPSVIDKVTTDMSAWKNEIFGPVLSVLRPPNLEEALAIGRSCPYGNGASIFTRSGHAAREFKRHFNAGMIGINVGVPAPMAWLAFTGRNQSFFGDLHIQGTEGVHFYTQQKMTLTRWFATADESHADPVWKTQR